MTTEERIELIAKYKAGYDEVIDSLKDFPAASLTAQPLAGKWSACEIVHHLGDSETTAAIRLRRLLCEDHPVIQVTIRMNTRAGCNTTNGISRRRWKRSARPAQTRCRCLS